MKFLCSMPDQDGRDWNEVEAFDHEDAAGKYAELCDESSGGELLGNRDEREVLVKGGDNSIKIFVVGAEMVKRFWAREPRGSKP